MAAETTVERFNGDYALKAGIRRMAKKGWSVQSVSSRKAAYSLLTGIFTRKQVHNVVFIREQVRPNAPQPAPLEAPNPMVEAQKMRNQQWRERRRQQAYDNLITWDDMNRKG